MLNCDKIGRMTETSREEQYRVLCDGTSELLMRAAMCSLPLVRSAEDAGRLMEDVRIVCTNGEEFLEAYAPDPLRHAAIGALYALVRRRARNIAVLMGEQEPTSDQIDENARKPLAKGGAVEAMSLALDAQTHDRPIRDVVAEHLRSLGVDG